MNEVHWTREDWSTSYISTAVLLKAGTSEQVANARIKNVVKEHSDDVKFETFLHPLVKWRLYSNFENGKQVGGQIRTVRLFLIIACLITIFASAHGYSLSQARFQYYWQLLQSVFKQ